MEKFNYLKAANADYIESLLQTYLQDPQQLDPSWQHFFEGMELGSPSESSNFQLEIKVMQLITAYRESGIRIADINPLEKPPAQDERLQLSRFGLSEKDLSQTCHVGSFLGLQGPQTVAQILAHLQSIYCKTIGIELSHIHHPEEREWLQNLIETTRPHTDSALQQWILQRLTVSETFEHFLHTRYVAQKRFSLEGAEALIPGLDAILDCGAQLGAREFVFGMAHRGRLNVLVNLFQQEVEHILAQFEGNYLLDSSHGDGDVKYHMGLSADIHTRSGLPVHLSMASNPSHLEFVNPVIQGMVRAKQFYSNPSQVIPITIHGDAALAGQGICYETLNLSQLQGYSTGGTLHVVINNQIGFTAIPHESRSSQYCTDLAKVLEIPIFHVNGDDPEAVYWVAQLATQYRQKFHKDVFIDLIGYRKYGHNEGDEPSFTQPTLYQTIKQHPSVKEIYAKRLGTPLTEATAELTAAQQRIKQTPYALKISTFEGAWKKFHAPHEQEWWTNPLTAIPDSLLKELGHQLNTLPKEFNVHPKLTRFFETRLKAIQEGQGIDWGNAEALAYASLLIEGHPVRLSGQDAQRGTFSHRHSVLHDTVTGETYTPLNHLRQDQAPYEVYNSHLSESAVLGFEYGYASSDPNTLVIWEAQFGDFANGAQVLIDQFITSAESKWQRMNGLTLLLPHGYEGQGPEHSSARMERFLQLAAKNNLTILSLSTPAQLFHGLRRQIKRDFRKPMVIFSPKSLLRHPHVISTLTDFSQGKFQEVLEDPIGKTHSAAVKKVLLCTGKIYYELLARQQAESRQDIAIIRLEQLYPFPSEKLAQLLQGYPEAALFWVQEEPKNMGNWSFLFQKWNDGPDAFHERISHRSIQYLGRDERVSPAVGSLRIHQQEQEQIIQKALI